MEIAIHVNLGLLLATRQNLASAQLVTARLAQRHHMEHAKSVSLDLVGMLQHHLANAHWLTVILALPLVMELAQHAHQHLRDLEHQLAPAHLPAI
ncbi:unnamed protein product [Blepharisma stoltei]|uniref:Secreted protein n=1 Tax=Blepharisma stoltei TaxID=1481888 RepID=A0AAU9J2L5_9CILI|nr:unnamed protein product [Blepharisma stoltei]